MEVEPTALMKDEDILDWHVYKKDSDAKKIQKVPAEVATP